MKFGAFLAVAGLLLEAVARAQTPAPPMPQAPQGGPDQPVRIEISPAPQDAKDTSAPKAAPAPKKDDAKSGATAKKAAPPAKKKEDPPATIDGTTIVRAKGGYLGLQVVNSNFVLSFYDDKKKKIAPDVARAGLRWPVKYQPGPERTVLNPGGNALTSGKTVKPPLNFMVFLSLYAEGSEEPVESYSVEFHQ
ncbi:MAG TPA: hypothetical protein VG838_05995 [Opitutaceae bacterium]|nr:hypothetical protein [Opitutaceae bacterium]